MASNTDKDVSKIPGAQFFPYYSQFASLTNGQGMDNQAAFMQQQVDTYNQSAKNQFEYLCNTWTAKALVARDAKQPLPDKPAASITEVFLRQDLPNNAGMWIATVDGPSVGTCPDLPPAQAAPGNTIITGGGSPSVNSDQIGQILGIVTEMQQALARQGIK